MHLRTILPVLFSMAGIFTVLVPFLVGTEVEDSTHIATGNNSYSYELNGQTNLDYKNLHAEVIHENGLFHLEFLMGADRQDRITFVLKETEVTERVYELDDLNKRYLSFEIHSLNCTYTADEYISGILMIHDYDREHHRISGSFEFMAFSDACPELVRVTDGKFDVTYPVR